MSKKQQEGRGQEESECICVFSSVHPHKIGILPCNVHMPPVSIWKSCYTSDAVSVEFRTRVVRILYS